MKKLRRIAVATLAVISLGSVTATKTYGAGGDFKPIAKEPAAVISYLANRGTAKPQEPDIVPLEDVDPMPKYTEAELEALALVIYQEAGADACSDETRYMVGTVALNRVADDRFPDTLEEVLLQERQYGRLAWTGLIWPERASRPGEAHAVERAYRQARELLDGTVTDVLPADVVWQAEFRQGSETVAESDGFYFCR